MAKIKELVEQYRVYNEERLKLDKTCPIFKRFYLVDAIESSTQVGFIDLHFNTNSMIRISHRGNCIDVPVEIGEQIYKALKDLYEE